jgi:hypothetical protein
MAAKDHFNPNQLRLFMTPTEIMKHFEPISGDFKRNESVEELWGRKAEESHDAGLTDSIRKQGVQVPVSLDIDRSRVVGGHHRIAAAHTVDPNMSIPVNYGSGSYDAHREEWRVIDTFGLDDLPNTDDTRYDPSGSTSTADEDSDNS